MWVEKPYRCHLTVNTHCSKYKALIVVFQTVYQSITLTEGEEIRQKKGKLYD